MFDCNCSDTCTHRLLVEPVRGGIDITTRRPADEALRMAQAKLTTVEPYLFTGVKLTPDQARELALHLLALVDEVEPKYDIRFLRDSDPRNADDGVYIARNVGQREAAALRRMTGDIVFYAGTDTVVQENWWLFKHEKPGCYAMELRDRFNQR